MPEILFDSQDAIPEGLRETAVQKDGKFVINVVPKAKLDEFRDNNIAVSKERDEFKAKYEPLASLLGEDGDPASFGEEIKQLRALKQQVDDGKLTGSDKIEREVSSRVEQMKKDFESTSQAKAREAAEWKNKALQAEERFKRSVVERAVTDAVVKGESGAEPAALPDIIARAASVFRVNEDGQVVPMKGDSVIYGANGADPMTPSEWLEALKEQAPYFFKGSTGGGATGGAGVNGVAGMSKEDFAKLNPKERLRLARKHGL